MGKTKEKQKKEFIKLTAQGMTQAAAARATGISRRTATNWTSNIKKGLKDSNRAAALYLDILEKSLTTSIKTLEKLDSVDIDLSESDPAQILELKRKYIETINKQITPLLNFESLEAHATLEQTKAHDIQQRESDANLTIKAMAALYRYNTSNPNFNGEEVEEIYQEYTGKDLKEDTEEYYKQKGEDDISDEW